MFVEIGHFYTDEEFDQLNLAYLREQKFNADDKLFLFIDDYTNPSKALNLELLFEEVGKIVNRPIGIYYEADMVQHFEQALSFLDRKKLQKISVNDVPTELRFDGRKIFDYTTGRPTCQMLSFTWTLFRLGELTPTYGWSEPVLTVIDRKYAKLEDRVFHMLPMHLRNRIFYRFFENLHSLKHKK
jgi:hypothetical protein